MINQKVICIHQPPFAPWLGIVESMFASDSFIIFDDVQFERGGYQNRNRIKSIKGSEWLTMPVNLDFGTQLNTVRIAENYSANSLIKTLRSSYGKSIFFNQVMPDLERILCSYKSGNLLCDLNVEILMWISNVLKCSCEFIYSSSLQITYYDRIDRIGKICSKLGATHLYSGSGMLGYCNPEDILKQGVIPIFHNYQNRHIVYNQRFTEKGFIPCLSVLDLFFNIGYNQSSELLKQSANKILKEALKLNTIY